MLLGRGEGGRKACPSSPLSKSRVAFVFVRSFFPRTSFDPEATLMVFVASNLPGTWLL